MRSMLLLRTDAAINLALGGLLAVFPRGVIAFLGLPAPETAFYASILGAVLIGIGFALIMGIRGGPGRGAGLGLLGAIVINMCAALVLMLWLVFGDLRLPARGYVTLWCVAVLVVLVAVLEVVAARGAAYRGAS